MRFPRITIGRVVGWMLAYVAVIFLVSYTYERWRIIHDGPAPQVACPKPRK